MQSNKSKGEKGELLAVEYFLRKGFEIASKNFRYRRSEIDLVVKRENLLAFVEVKYRSSMEFGQPEEFVSENQQFKIIEAADEYIHQKNWQGNIRFDIIAINAKEQIDHFEDAFH